MSTSQFDCFLENARLLFAKFDIVPLLYGSLGLEYLTGEALGADDIDILIPNRLLTSQWELLQSVLLSQGYVLTDEHEHTFVRDGIVYSYAAIEELEPFVGIRIKDIVQRKEQDVRFLLLSPEQYLCVYRQSIKDGYRVHVRQKKDGEKILLIEGILHKEDKDRDAL